MFSKLSSDSLSGKDEALTPNAEVMEEDDPMQFHPVSQGSSIVLDMGGRRATRDVDSFCNGVVFSKVNFSSVKAVLILSSQYCSFL